MHDRREWSVNRRSKPGFLSPFCGRILILGTPTELGIAVEA